MLVAGCGSPRADGASLDAAPTSKPTPPKGDPCARPTEGCPCDDEEAEVECESIKEQRGDYLICWRGVRICSDGEWSECIAENLVTLPRDQKESAEF